MSLQTEIYSKVYSFEFMQEDYSFSSSEKGYTSIHTSTDAVYEEFPNPPIPMHLKNIALPYGSQLSNFTFTFSTPRKIRENVIIPSHPHIMPTHLTRQCVDSHESVLYADGIYPPVNVNYEGSHNISGINLTSFILNPFIYDSEKKELYFIDEFLIDINLEPYDTKLESRRDISEIKDLLMEIACNYDEIDSIVEQIPTTSYYYKDKIEYLIITTNELENAFHNLLRWKRTKGIFGGIITLEELKFRYQGADMAEKIKRCIYNAFHDYDLKYVILGGDDTIVPTRYCYSYAQSIEESSMPCDKYYGCFKGNFLWDANNNNIFGEVDDEIDFEELVYVSRIPVRTIAETNAYVSKLINYETGNSTNELEKSIITAGVNLNKSGKLWDGRSDADLSGDTFYKNYIKKYWDGNRIRFYDTGTDFPGNQDYDVSPVNFQKAISSNSMFLSMDTHGRADAWKLEGDSTVIYDIRYVNELNQTSIPIISTSACNTNAFDDVTDPCLSESFIRNSNNRVIAYLGSSRYGWSSPFPYIIDGSMLYEGLFYRYLFKDMLKEKHLGQILAYAKLNMSSKCSKYDYNRWLQMSINLIGDAETPIFTDIPLEFKNVKILYSPENKALDIDTNEDDCRISVISYPDNGLKFHEIKDETSTLSLDKIPEQTAVAVTKSGYKPYLYIINNESKNVVQGEATYDINGIHLEESLNREAISSSNRIRTMAKKGEVLEISLDDFINDNIRIELQQINGGSPLCSYSINSSTVSIDLSEKTKGVYTVKIVSNGEITDVKKLII